ncbi:galactitol-1-phosphate 5-dehydrogenase [Candidatus Sumerlaeota bacterium]|nr:galactitol-1-phosphate 5-dehydrogenase [Candidatus Sumerlaeota bacterium]
MKALVYTRPFTFEYTDWPEPVVGDDDVLVCVKACGICGSDVQGATGKTGRRIPPLIMGHEAAGIVERVGNNAGSFQPRDRVCFDSTVYCNKCEQCKLRRYNRCEKREVFGVSTDRFKRHGAFAEYVAVPWWTVAKIPDSLSFREATMLEPLSIALHAANRVALSPTDRIVVIGAGTIGLLLMQAVRMRGVRKVIVSDINSFRLNLARQLGADVIVNPSESNLGDVVFRETEGRGANVTFDAVGYARTFESALVITKTGGSVVAIGNLEKTATINIQDLVARELTITGSYASAGEFRECIDLLSSKRICAESLISDVMPLCDGQGAFDRLLSGKENLIKIILEP